MTWIEWALLGVLAGIMLYARWLSHEADKAARAADRRREFDHVMRANEKPFTPPPVGPKGFGNRKRVA